MKCSLCGDEAVPAVVLLVDAASDTATIEIEGERRTVALDLVHGVGAGDTLLIHQGFAIAKVDRP